MWGEDRAGALGGGGTRPHRGRAEKRRSPNGYISYAGLRIILAVVAAATAILLALGRLVPKIRPPSVGGERREGGADDVAKCLGEADNATARLLDDISGTVFAAGGNVHPPGTTRQFVFRHGPTPARGYGS